MTFREIDPKKLALLLTRGTHEGELKRFFTESRLKLIQNGAKVQNIPHVREERIKAICERLPPKTDEVLRSWFHQHISVANPVPSDEVLLFLGAHFDEGEPLPEVEAQVICRSALTYLFGSEPNEEFLRVLKRPRGLATPSAAMTNPSHDSYPLPETSKDHRPLGESDHPSSIRGPENFQIAELLTAIISGDEDEIDRTIEPFAETTRLLVEALLRLREGNGEAAKERLMALDGHEPEAELLRSALTQATHLRDASETSRGIRIEIPKPLDEEPHIGVQEIIGVYTNESDTGAVFVKPLFLVLEGELRRLDDASCERLFPESGSVMTFKSKLSRPPKWRELVHWQVSKREGTEGKTRFHLDSELSTLIEAVRIQVPSSDPDEVRYRIKAYASERRGRMSPQMIFLLADGVAIASPKDIDITRDEAFESPWRSWGSLKTWLIEGGQYCLEAPQGSASHLDLSTLDVAFRRLLKNLDAEHRLTITNAQRTELSIRLRNQIDGDIGQRAKRVAASIDQLSINEEELSAVLKLLGSHEEVRRRVDELVAKEYSKSQSEKTGLQSEITTLKKKKLTLEKEGSEIERTNRARAESAASSVREAFSEAVRDGAAALANAEVFKLLTGNSGHLPRETKSLATPGKMNNLSVREALSTADVTTRLSTLGINKRQAFLLSSLAELLTASGVALILRGGMARQCVQTLVRQNRNMVALIDIPMGITTSDHMREIVMNLDGLQGIALLNADLSPLTIYGAELIDRLIEQAMPGGSISTSIFLSCLGDDFSLPLPKAIYRVSLLVDLDTDWDQGQQTCNDLEDDSLLLLPALKSRIFDAFLALSEDDRRHIEPTLVRALRTE